MFNAIFCRLANAHYYGDQRVHLWAFWALWILIGRLPDGDFTIRFASPMAGGIKEWGNAQMDASFARWLSKHPTPGLIARRQHLEEQIVLGFDSAKNGLWTYSAAGQQERELDKQIRSIMGELQARDLLGFIESQRT